MVSPILGIRIEGGTDAAGKVHTFGTHSMEDIRRMAQERARKTVFKFKQEMAAEYTSKWATGALARGIHFKTQITNDGIDVQFFINDRRELRYVTAIMGGHFQRFPVGPFLIIPKTRKALLIPFPNSMARQFIRGAKGQFTGSLGGGEDGPRGGALVRRVIWGRRTGGFSRDVINEVAQQEGVLFVQDMQSAIENSIVTMTT
jgi:hypothetical protein